LGCLLPGIVILTIKVKGYTSLSDVELCSKKEGILLLKIKYLLRIIMVAADKLFFCRQEFVRFLQQFRYR
jgi:hypothetical protein